MAEDVYIAGLGPGVPQWSNEATQLQVLNALNSGFSSNTNLNRQIMNALSNLSKGETKSSNSLSNLVNGIKKTESTIKKGNSTNESNVAVNKKQTGFLASLSNILSDTNRTAKKHLNITKRIAEYEKQGLSTAEANLRANIESSEMEIESLWGDAKDGLAKVAQAFSIIGGIAAGVKASNTKTIEGSSARYDMAQEMRQSGILAGMDSAGAGLINLSQTISRSNFTFGEAANFTRQFSQAVGVRGVQASMDFANTLAKSGEGNSDMMQRFGMEFSEVAEIAGSYMESVRSIGQLDKLSDNQMRMGMDNFMDTVVSTSNVMKINLQDAANLIAETLKQDQFASQLALMEPEMRKNVEAMVGRFGGEGSILGSGIATAMAAGSTQDFLQTDVAQQLQGDVIGQKLLPLITQMAETARTQGPEAANALYADMGPQFDAILQFARDNKALINLNEGMSQAIVTQLARIGQSIEDADKGEVTLTKADKAINALIETQRFTKLAGEANETLVLRASDLAGSLTTLVESSLILTQELATLGAATAAVKGGLREVALNAESGFNLVTAGALQITNAAIPDNAGSKPELSYDALSVRELIKKLNPGRMGVGIGDESMEGLRDRQNLAQGEGDLELQKRLLVENFKASDDKEAYAKEMKSYLKDMKEDDSWLPGNYFNSDAVKKNNAGIDQLLGVLKDLVNSLK